MTTRAGDGRVARVREQLSERDFAVLSALYRLRLLRADQVQRLFVSEGSLLTQSRRTRSMLKRLHDLGLVSRLGGRAVGGQRSGSQAYVYGLTGLGQAVLGVPGPFGRRRRRIWETKPFFENHVLQVAELFVNVVEAVGRSKCELLDFDGEPACWRRFAGSGGELVTLKPDAYVRLGVGGWERSVFIEMDLATESAPTVQRKCQVFIAYWRSGVEQQLRQVFPGVVWLVPDERRRERITAVIGKLAAEAQTLFTVALHQDGAALLTTVTEGGAT